MSHKSTAVITTACVGLAATTAAYLMTENKSMRHRTKGLRKNTGKALRQMGDFIENVSYMMK